ncbi:MAG: HlyD family efflux transporter periplasmic adaptor subunit [Cyanobacteriota bacterium]|nr:HlyD family efflux transporter periplasmic adaptor subunit [Cyanobacteriota bacterium]
MINVVVYNIDGRVRIADGPKDSIIVYTSNNITPLEFSGTQGAILNWLRDNGPGHEHDLSREIGTSEDSLKSALEALVSLQILKKEDIPTLQKIETEPEETRKSVRIDRYEYFIADIDRVLLFGFLPEKIDFFKLNAKLLPWMLLIAAVQIYSFFLSPSRPLGSKINLSLIYTPSIFEVIIIFLLCNLSSVLFKISVGSRFSFGSSNLYLRLLAGFSPFFASDKDPNYSENLGISRLEYFLYLASPQVMRLYLMMLGILIINLAYPFTTRAAEIVLSSLFTVINLSLFSFFWQSIPSPGTLGYKTLEVLNLIPPQLFGLSVRKTLKTLVRSDGESSINGLFREKRYKLFLIGMVLLVLAKVAFLLIIVLPQVSIGLPTIFGRWSSQIFYLILLFAVVRYMTYTYAPKSNRKSKEASTQRNANRSVNSQSINQAINQKDNKNYARSSNPESHFQKFNLKKSLFAQKWFILVLIIILLFPIPSNVIGSATVEESMSLEIKSSEPETVTIQKVYHQGPSSEIIRRDLPLLQLQSPALEDLIEKSKSNIQSYKSDVSLLIIEAEALKQGSRVVEAKGKTDSVEQGVESKNATIQQIASLEKQLYILNDQVRRYKGLTAAGAVSELQYQEKLLEAETAQSNLNTAISELKKSTVELRRSRREELLEQSIRIGEDLRSNQDKLIKANSALINEEKTLAELNRRRKGLSVKAPFDCVVNSDTSLLLGKTVVVGEALISVKSVPTEFVVINIPEYNRSEIQIGDRVDVRLYTTYAVTLHGKINSISPVAAEEDSQEQLSLGMKFDKKLPDAFIGSTGTAKIRTGYSCLLLNILKPIARFVYVDLWQFLP